MDSPIKCDIETNEKYLNLVKLNECYCINVYTQFGINSSNWPSALRIAQGRMAKNTFVHGKVRVEKKI